LIEFNKLVLLEEDETLYFSEEQKDLIKCYKKLIDEHIPSVQSDRNFNKTPDVKSRKRTPFP